MNRVYCEDCAHVHERKRDPPLWLCMKFKRIGYGYVVKDTYPGEPYMRCSTINAYGTCPLFKAFAPKQQEIEI